MNKRQNYRKYVSAIRFEDLTALKNYNIVVDEGFILNASVDGFLIELERDSLRDYDLKDGLSLDGLLGCHVAVHLPQMGLDLDGYIMRTHHTGKGIYTAYIEFSSEVPEYWRDCLLELLPSDEDLEDTTYAS